MSAFLPFGIAEAVAVALLAWLLSRSHSGRWLADRPNERSLHEVSVPKVGGLAIMAVALPAAAMRADAIVAILLACALGLALLSFVDDLRSLPIQVRLPAHFAAAAAAVLAIEWLARGEASGLETVLAIVAIAWMTNLYNFMDGTDGLAGGMAAIGFATYAAVAWQAGAMPVAWCGACLCAAAVGFLFLNLPPARLFMGDAGSIPLGFLAGTLGYAGWVEDAWPSWFPLLVFSPFIVDATVTLVRRMLRGDRFWRAHREHAYQRLVLAGWSKRRLVFAELALMAAAAASALWALRQEAMLQCVILAAWSTLFLLIFFAIERYLAAVARDRKTPAAGIGP